MPDTYRPTLFDFLAFDALSFYTSGEQAGSKAEDAFELTADSPILSSVEDFMAWDVKTTDAGSLTVRAIRLYQNILKFHKDDKDLSAFCDANLDRLQFGYNKASGNTGIVPEKADTGKVPVLQDKNARYKAALEKFVEKWADHETSARGRFLHASVLQQESDLVGRQTCGTGIRYFSQQRWRADVLQSDEAD